MLEEHDRADNYQGCFNDVWAELRSEVGNNAANMIATMITFKCKELILREQIKDLV